MVDIIQVRKSVISGVIRCPSSKSYSHRAIAIGSLTNGSSLLTNALLARDTLATISACKLLGANIKYVNGDLRIEGKVPPVTPENIINVENSGTTLRLVSAMSSLVRKGFTVITGDESLRKRPMQPILDALIQLGVKSYSTRMNGFAPLIVKSGGIKGGISVVDGSISSQFISALLISCIYADSKVILKIVGDQVSKPYIESTLATMRAFGVTVIHEPDYSEYHIENTEYSPTVFNIPGDFSAAALIISAGVLTGEGLTVQGLNFDLPQGDTRIVEIIRTMGGKIGVNKEKGEVVVSSSYEVLEGGQFDLTDNPDLLPVVSILALKARSQVRISGIAHARLKETDRVANISSELSKLGALVKQQNDEILITPPKVLKNACLESFNDHRLFMAFTIASMLTEQSTVAGAESVDVSYPNFIEDMRKLNAVIRSSPTKE